MKQLTASVDSTEGLIAFLGRSETKFAVASSRSVLVQIYTGVCEERWICDLVGSVRQHIPAATIAGATTFGEIREAQAMTGGTVVILSCFQSATVEALQLPCTAGQEERAALVLADNLRRAPEPIKAVLLLATTLSLDATALLSHLFATMPGLPLFGGGAGDNGALQQSFVFSDNGVIQEGLVAIAVCGGTLEIIRHTYLGWEPMGKAMTVTQVSGLTLHTLDGAPAFDVYRRYLGIDADEFFFKNAMEFPFLVERHGRLFARIPAEVLDDGSIKFTADIQEGEVLQFGYAHVDSLVANVTATEAAVRRFAPEAINIYSCGTRHFVMQDDVSLELAPFQNIASTAGFFTYGEFCDLGVGSPLLNSTLVVVGMREGPAPDVPAADPSAAEIHQVDIYKHNHARILMRFQHFTRVITEELASANQSLARLADHDVLTGLHNRRALESRLADEIRRAQRYERKFSLVFGDVDHFKVINDTFGHAAGDAVLKQLATIFRLDARATDMVCRYGGEEFVLLLAETTPQEALTITERIRLHVQASSFAFGQQSLPAISMSFGISSYPSDAVAGIDLIVKADAALYEAKGDGRNCVRLARPAAT